MKQADFRIEGLDCAEEVAILRKEVGGLEGVSRLDFDILNARMSVAYDPALVDEERIVAAVAAGGMKATPWTRRAAEPESGWTRYGRLIMACASAAFAVAGFIAHWKLHGNILHALDIGGHAGGHTYPVIVILFYLASVAAGAWFVLPKALISARELRPDMNLLMTIAVLGAIGIGEWLEAAMVAFLFSVSLLLEHWSVGRARRAISALMEISPSVARCLDPETGAIRERPVEEVLPGTTLVVRPGEKIPLDGRVCKGLSSVNQAPITGESVPVEKKPGDELFAGTINEDGSLEFVATRKADDTTLARIVRMVSEAHGRRARSERWVEKFARTYTPTMIALAALIFLIPPLFLGGGWAPWLYRALVILVIACPCALVISTPVSIVSGLTAAARNGVLIKGGIHLEMVGHLDALALDKTGTLTYGRPEVQEIATFQGHTRQEVLARAAALEVHSNHPLARAILREAEAENLAIDRAEGFRAVHGEGAEGLVFDRPFWIGSHRMMDVKGQETPESHNRATELEDAGHSVVALGNDQHVCGLISLADKIREGAAETVGALRRAGIRHVVMLTGDNEGTASAVAQATGMSECRAELLPQDKVEAVQSLVKEYEHVGMVGDGVNDAPAMAAATVGIAMGAAGSDAAIETSDIALMSDDLSKLPWLIRHSQRTVGIIRQNVFFAIGLKIVFMVLAVLGIATLWMAIAADMGASLLVIFNSLRLLKIRAGNQ
jgi:Zn2+/Cd2+-exporting ATPase